MVIHAFAFRWKPNVTADQKLRVQTEILALQGQIPGLLETHVGFTLRSAKGTNFSERSQGYEFAGVMKFTDRAALTAYNSHPIHQKLLTWLLPLIDPIELDFDAST
jgi:stress responsive alpha/beta barrel protein